MSKIGFLKAGLRQNSEESENQNFQNIQKKHRLRASSEYSDIFEHSDILNLLSSDSIDPSENLYRKMALGVTFRIRGIYGLNQS